MSKKIFHITDYPTIKHRPEHNHNNRLTLKSRHLRVGLPFIGVMILSLLLMSFDVSAASLPSTQEHLSANKAKPPLPSDGTYFDSPITTYATFPGPVKVAIGGKSLYEKGYRINEISDDFTVTLQACGNGENPEIVAAYLQWYQRWRGNSNTTQFDSTINVKINDSPFKNNLEIDSEKGQKWARIQEKDGGQGRTWIRRNALLELDILQSEWQSGDNTIAFSGLMPPGVGSGVENNETYGIGIHVFYECQDFPDVLTTFSTGLDWFYYFNVKDYADAYSDLSCFTFPPAPSITNVTIDALLGGQAELGPNNLRGSVIKYRTGNDSDGFPQENPVKPTGNAVYNHSSAVQIGVAEGDTAIWKSNLGREWDAYSNQQSGHDIVVQANDTWLCFQAKSTPVKTDGQGNLVEGGSDRGISGDLFSVAFSIPIQDQADWGDLPDSIAGSVDYNTDSAGIAGASHPIIPELQLGQTIDAELDGQPSAEATGDDNAPATLDDEDGVVLPATLQIGQANLFTVTASNTTGQNAFVHGFVDWNADGDFDDENEQTTETIPAGSTDATVILSFTPAEIDKNVNFGARFRLSTDAALGPDGPATNGEVEDYILIYPPEPPVDWGDLPDSIAGSVDYNTDSAGIAGASHPIIPELQLGQTIDAELDGQPSAEANGDDNSPATQDDEDGVVLTNLLQVGQINEFLARVSNTTGQDAFVYGFIDWNADGDFDDANEAIREIVPTGSVNNPVSLAFTPAEIAENVNFGARFRLSTDAALGPDGPATNGEVEDYILIYPPEPPADWGDLPDTTPGFGSNNYNTDKDGPVEGPSHPIISELQIGDRNDPELDGQQSATADGDDLNGDDEDGVDLPDPTKLQINQPNTFTVTVSNSTGQDAILYGFVDWDGNGQFLGETERISTTIPTGLISEIVTLSLSPTTLISGTNIGIRFRLATDANLGPDGPATNGEVEDYMLIVVDSTKNVTRDRGDLPESLYTTSITQSGPLIGPSHVITYGLRMGDIVDGESDGQPTTFANGDDAGTGLLVDGLTTSAIDDEDGVQFPDKFVLGKTADITVTAVNTRGVSAYLSGFVDWNRDGDFDDESESQVQTVPSTAASDPQSFIFTFAVPETSLVSTDTVSRNLGVRFRLSTTPNLSAVDSKDIVQVNEPDGEVEDYLVNVYALYDRGDLPEPLYTTTMTQSGPLIGPSHLIVPGLYLGEMVDGEADGQPHHFANGDDDLFGSGPDDEDGVLLPRLIEIGKTAEFKVTAVNTRSVDAYLYAFVDWNGDGDFTDESEALTQLVPSKVGPQLFTMVFNVPTTTLESGEGNLNDLGLRFRLSTSQGLTAHDTRGEPVPDGEVEDYLIPAETDVDIVDFNHQLGETGKVTLTWGALGEANNISFRIYRTDSPVFENARYEGSVASKWPDTHEDERTNYQFVDYVGESGTYTYWLFSIDVNGHYKRHSSTTETVAGPTYKLFLPIAPQN